MKLEIQKRSELLVKEVQNSKNLSADEKGDLQDILLHAEEGTNGLTQEEKLQHVSETVFSIVTMMVSQRLDGFGKLNAICKVIIETKWQICIVVGTLAMALVFRPEVAEILKAVLK